MTVATYRNSEVKLINGQYVVYVGREIFGTYPTLEAAEQQAKNFDGDVLLD